jgi:hypothetical protein
VSLVDGSGNQVISFGGGTQYAEGATAATITGSAMLWEDSGDTLRSVSAAKPLPVNVVASGGLTDAQLRATAVPVSGTFFQSTQPISAASLPLPSGAATSAKQPALGTAGTAAADVITVQGVASMTPLKVDGSGVTQPVTGTFWPATQPVSIGSVLHVDDNGGSLTVDGSVSVSGLVPGTSATSLGKAEDAAAADGDTGVMALAVRKDTATTTVGTDGDYHPFEVDGNGRLWVNGSSITQPVSGTITGNQGSAAALGGAWPVKITDGTNTMPTGDASARSIHTTIDNASIAVTGTFWQATQAVNGTVTANIGTAGTLALDATLTGGTQKSISFGDVAHDGVDSGNPQKIGGKATTGVPTAVSATADRVDAYFDRMGRQAIFTGSSWTANHQPAAATKATTTRASAGAGVKNVCTALSVWLVTLGTAPTAASVVFNLIDGASGGTVIQSWTIRVPATINQNMPAIILGDLWIEGTASTAMTLEMSAAPGVNIQGGVNMVGTTTA